MFEGDMVLNVLKENVPRSVVIIIAIIANNNKL